MRLEPRTVSEWLPNIIQIAGIVLAFLIVFGAIAGHIQDVAPLGVLALGMILGKVVRNAAQPPDDDGAGEEKRLSHQERWSHLE